MTAEKRRVSVERWTCPNHPDGPPTLPADGYEREELTLPDAYDAAEVDALRQVVEAAERAQLHGPAETVAKMFGLCCLGHKWKVVGYEWVEVGSYERLLLSMRGSLAQFPQPTILLAELSASIKEPEVRIPLVQGGSDA